MDQETYWLWNEVLRQWSGIKRTIKGLDDKLDVQCDHLSDTMWKLFDKQGISFKVVGEVEEED
jgi:hypothetical protein